MDFPEKIRIDKWLWAVRIFKSRSIAAEACKKGQVMIDGVNIKPSREIAVGDEIQVKRSPIIYTYLVKAISGKRMSAKLAVDFVEDITPQDQFDLLNAVKTYGFEQRDRGVGRPTKKDRRDIEKLKNR
jgi:ribosome-associated heat shock protein Hsp15